MVSSESQGHRTMGLSFAALSGTGCATLETLLPLGDPTKLQAMTYWPTS